MILVNADFEGGWTRQTHTGQEFGEIFVPEGWTAFWREGGEVPHDPDNLNGYGRPEMHVINREPPYFDPPRIYEGNQALKLFTFYRIHDAGYYQRVEVQPGAVCNLSVLAHAWSSTNDDPHTSDTEGDAAYNMAFMVGIDPYGETDPWDDSIIWSKPCYIYDQYHVTETIIATAQADHITVFIRSIVRYPFKHCDAYFDNVQFSVQNNVPIELECRGLPRVQYDRTYNLLPQNATEEQLSEVASKVHSSKETIGFSADDAGLGALDYKVVDVWWFDDDSWESAEALDHFFDTYYPDTIVRHLYHEHPEPDPPPDPDPDFTPINYTPQGCKLNWHGVGDDGQTDVQRHVMARGTSMATAKAVQDVGWLRLIKQADLETRTVARFIDDGQGGPSLEWFDSNQDPHAQAYNRMNALAPLFAPHRAYVDYWEIMNEQDPVGVDGHVNMALFFMTAMDIADGWGYKLALFSYSMGVPEPHEWDAIAETGIFERAARGGHAISLHEYGVWSIDQGSLLTRYRYVYEKHILPRGLNIPLFITEWAPDAWTLDMFHDNELMAQIAAYDAELAKDPYVAGAHIFTVGGASGWPQFRNRWVELYGRYEDYVVNVKDRANNA